MKAQDRRVLSLIGIAGFFLIPFTFMKYLYKPVADTSQELTFVAVGALWVWGWIKVISYFERRSDAARAGRPQDT
jgi:hypothetical protein